MLLTYLFGHYNLLQVFPNAGEPVLVCDIHHLVQIRRLYELGWSCPYEEHPIQDAVF